MRTFLLMLMLGLIVDLYAQVDERVAFVPSRPLERTADDMRINFLEPAIPGSVEVTFPQGTHTVDLLNSRGRVKRTLDITSLDELHIQRLRRGSWTLRAHTAKGMVVRRFLVLGRGYVMWDLPRPRRR